MFRTGPIKSNHVIYYVVPETIDKTRSSPKLVLDNKVSFFYVFQQGAVTGATECLAFSNGATGVIRTVFFRYLLPDNKFVITDFDYTKEGHRWFEAQYFYAFTHPERYDVYSINMQTKEVNQVDRIQFLGMQESWRGVGRGHLSIKKRTCHSVANEVDYSADWRSPKAFAGAGASKRELAACSFPFHGIEPASPFNIFASCGS